MGMDVEVVWDGKPEYPEEGTPEHEALCAMSLAEYVGTRGYIREQYGVNPNAPCELCPLIAEAFDPDRPIIEGFEPVPHARIPAAVLRERVPAAQERVRVRYGTVRGESGSVREHEALAASVRNVTGSVSFASLLDERELAAFVEQQVEAIDAWVGLIERLEAEGKEPLIFACP